jgi:hypothetical protein
MSAKPKRHAHLPISFDEALKAIANSKYKDKKAIEKKKPKQKK